MTSESLEQVHGVPVLALPPDGPRLESDRDAVDLIAKAAETNRGNQLWFVATTEELDRLLSRG